MALTPQEQAEFDGLSRRIKAAGYKPPKTPDPQMVRPPKQAPRQPVGKDRSDEVIQALRASTDKILSAIPHQEEKETPQPEQKPKVWKFTHRYDVYNKLIETTATSE
jgi:hypothetical protein